MKIELWSIGRGNEPYIEEGVRLFSERLRHYTDFSLRIIAPPRNAAKLNTTDAQRQEAAIILSQLDKSDYLVALDEKGKQMSTESLAAFLQQRQNSSVRRLVILIGGAYGLDESICRSAQTVLSLSMLTFPHQLVRLIVCEQLYRAFTVLKNEKYHHQ